MKRTIQIIFFIVHLCLSMNVLSQYSDTNIFVSFDYSTRWIWRGASYSDVPVLQPSLGYSGKKLNANIWSSYPVNNNGYAEVDFIIEYNITGQIKLGFTDYFAIPDNRKFNQKFFDFENKSTAHLYDVYTAVNPLKEIPLQLFCSWWFYGMDKDTVTLKQNHSIYLEAMYRKKIRDFTVHALCGATPQKSFYYHEAAVVNLGIGVSHLGKLNNHISIPFKAEFVLNPATENIFFYATVGIRM